jgi:F-type H+-transporting ATPase subunit b
MSFFLWSEVVMQRGWLLALVMFALVLSAAPAWASDAPKHKGDPKKQEEAVEKSKQRLEKGGKPDDILSDIEKYIEEATPKAEPDIFKGFIDLSIWSIVVFGVLLLVLWKYAWGPMLQGLQKREDTIHGAMEEARQAKEEATKLRAELQADREKARAEAQAERDAARRDAERLRDEINARTKAEIEAERDRLHKEIETAKDQLLHDVYAHMAQVSTMVASKAIKRQMNIDDQNRLVDEALAELRGAAEGRQRTMASIQ